MSSMIRVGESFRRHPPEVSYDAIVVGSGIGGLASAALLAKHAGKRVLVLERHYMPGGFTHVFRRRGYEWDVGVHYIGGMGSRKSGSHRLFEHVTDGSVEWASMGSVYDRIAIAGEIYDYEAGPQKFRARMKSYFPDQHRAIDRYLELLGRVQKASAPYFGEKAVPGAIAAVAGRLMRAPFLRFARRTTGDVLDEITDDRRLKAVLTGQLGDYGLPPARSSFAMHAILANHYLWGGFYPVGGSSVIAAAIAPVIEAAGGKILFQADVERILLSERRAVGVRMTDGTELRAPLIVSDAGVRSTFERLLPADSAAEPSLPRSVAKLPPSVSHLCLYVGFKATAAELGLPKSNLWIYPGDDHDASFESYLADPQAPLPLVYVSFPSAKDPSFERRHPGRATIELITLAPFERFEPWAGSEWRKRGADYEALKEGLASRMLDELDRFLPGLRTRIDYMEISTPLSTRHFAGYERGEIYGLDHSPARFEERSLKPGTSISGLFLTGQDIASCGVIGALVGGYLTGSAILGKNLLSAAMKNGGSP